MSDDFDPLDDGDFERDGRKRPLIIPTKRDGTPNPRGKRKAYTRASTFAKALSDGAGLTTWRVRHGAHGVAISPDLAAMVAALGNPDELTADQKRDLDAILETAHDRSGGNAKANYGTAVHSLTEPGNNGTAISDGMAADVEAYGIALDDGALEPIDAEQRVVNDELAVAGTYDHRYRVTRPLVVRDKAGEIVAELVEGAILLGDKKTGSLHFDEHAIQLAVYARSKAYDVATGERTALDASPLWGVLAHIPKGKAEATLYLVDLAAGWKAARLAVEVRAYRSSKSRLAHAFASGKAERPEPAVDEIKVDEIKVDEIKVDGVTGGPVVPVPTAGNPHATIPSPSETAADVPPHGTDGEETTAAAAEPVETTRTDTPDPLGVAAAVELATRKLGAVDLILAAIRVAKTRDECAELWREHEASGAWRDEHTEAVRARLAELAA